MKKIVLAALLLVVALSQNNTAFAQKGLSFSIKAAPQITYIRNQPLNHASDFETGRRFTASYGAGVGYNFTTKLGIAADFLYSMQGWKTRMTPPLGRQPMYTSEMNYFKVPVLVTYSSDPQKVVSLVVKAGPQVSFLHSSRASDSAGHVVPEGANMNANYTRRLYGIAGMGGVQVKLQKHFFLTTGLRFDYDFTNADAASINNVRPAGPSHNTTTGLEVGLQYVVK